jgi:hypothetical protein
MADKRTTSSGSEGGRSRAAEFTPKPDPNKSPAKTETERAAAPASEDAKPGANEGEASASGDARPAETASAAASGNNPATASASTPRVARTARSSGSTPDARALATEVPVKIAPVPELSEYVVTVDNKTGLVTRIERFNAATAERQPLSPAGHARVASQFLTTTASAGRVPGAVIPEMLNAPAFNILLARSAAASPAFSEATRSAVESGLLASAEGPVAPPARKSSVAADSTAVLQAYYQGALDYLNALATGAVNGR